MKIQPVYIKENTKELCNSLIGLGYEILVNPSDFGIVTCGEVAFGIPNNYSNDKILECNNKELFLALAALDNSNDRNQWFVDNLGNWCKCILGDFKNYWWEVSDKLSYYSVHKATVLELIEKFKNEKSSSKSSL